MDEKTKVEHPEQYPSMAELIEQMPDEEPSTRREMEYRRGYRAGFIAAANVMVDLWELGSEQAFDRLFDFWERDLRLWTLEASDKRIPPPRPDVVEWVTTEEAAELTGYKPVSLRWLARKGRIRGHKRGRDWYLDKANVLAYVEEMERLGPAKHDPTRGQE